MGDFKSNEPSAEKGRGLEAGEVALAGVPEHTLHSLHDLSWGDARVGGEEKCGCFYCMETFAAGEVDERVTNLAFDGQTALCPRCGIDSVLVGKSVEKLGVKFDRGLLEEMREYWFASDGPELPTLL